MGTYRLQFRIKNLLIDRSTYNYTHIIGTILFML